MRGMILAVTFGSLTLLAASCPPKPDDGLCKSEDWYLADTPTKPDATNAERCRGIEVNQRGVTPSAPNFANVRLSFGGETAGFRLTPHEGICFVRVAGREFGLRVVNTDLTPNRMRINIQEVKPTNGPVTNPCRTP